MVQAAHLLAPLKATLVCDIQKIHKFSFQERSFFVLIESCIVLNLKIFEEA